ncbi:MAG: hypothetical protein ACUVQX_02495 [Candidatus Bathycorpusculaceae bacterium]
MSIKSKLKIGNVGISLALAFYAVVGIVCFVVLPMANFPPHIGIIGILSLITAYGLFKKRVWSVWLMVMLLFIATTFSACTLYSYFGKDILLDISVVAYLILTWIFTIYIAAKRKVFQNRQPLQGSL